jgi:hypothetical protein
MTDPISSSRLNRRSLLGAAAVAARQRCGLVGPVRVVPCAEAVVPV